jgi:hypothetical protein
MSAALAHKAQECLHALGAHLLGDTLGGQRQGIHQVRQAHQVMIALQGIPVIREGVFIVVALTLFDQEAGLDAPALAGAQIAALVDVVGVQTLAGQPTRAGSAYR